MSHSVPGCSCDNHVCQSLPFPSVTQFRNDVNLCMKSRRETTFQPSPQPTLPVTPITAGPSQTQNTTPPQRRQRRRQQQHIPITADLREKMSLPWIPRKLSEGPTRPLVNMKGKTPAQYYGLRKITLQDIAMNAIFDNHGCGYDSLPPPLQRMYYNHIYIITITNKNDKTIHCVQKWLGSPNHTGCAHPST